MGINPATRSERFAALPARKINQDIFLHPWPEAGLAAMQSPADPCPNVLLDEDGVAEAEYDATETAQLILDAADTYKRAGLLRPPTE